MSEDESWEIGQTCMETNLRNYRVQQTEDGKTGPVRIVKAYSLQDVITRLSKERKLLDQPGVDIHIVREKVQTL